MRPAGRDIVAVMRPARWQRGIAELARLVDAGLGVNEFRAQSLGRLRSLISIDAAFYATVEPATMVMTSALTKEPLAAAADEPLAAAADRFFDNEYGTDDVNKFTVLADAIDPVGSLDHATRGEPTSSPRYRDLMATMGLGDEARAALRSRGQCWGVLCLHREDSDTTFDDDELALLRRVAPLLGEGLRRGLAVSSTATGDAISGGPGVLILDADLALVSS